MHALSKMEEVIVVAPRAAVFANERHAFHGFLALREDPAGEVLRGLCAAPFHARRGDVEDDPSLLQPIPYVVVTRGTADRREVFAYTRLGGGGEHRLHGRVSIGVGGHMNHLFDEVSLGRVVREEATRELEEELAFEDHSGAPAPPPEARLIGLINDDSGPVQRVHIGLLALAEVPEGVTVSVRETEQLEGSWVTLPALAAGEMRARMEEWSLHALAGLPAA